MPTITHIVTSVLSLKQGTIQVILRQCPAALMNSFTHSDARFSGGKTKYEVTRRTSGNLELDRHVNSVFYCQSKLPLLPPSFVGRASRHLLQGGKCYREIKITILMILDLRSKQK